MSNASNSDENSAAIDRATYFEYTSAADPSTFMTKASKHVFPSSLHDAPGGCPGVFHLDASAELNLEAPATSPNLLASFIRVALGAPLAVSAVATSSVYYCIRGSGSSTSPPHTITWAEGDVFTLPGGAAEHASAAVDSALLWLCDAPLLTYLCATPKAGSGLKPALYPAAKIAAELAAANAQKGAGGRNRNGVLLGHADLPETRTATGTLWALYNMLPPGVVQPPHRHASVAIDYAVRAGAGVYTLMSPTLAADGTLVDPIRADWVAGAVFTTPPGWWHSHHNESGEAAIVLPLQDAGLYTHMRTLGIEFAAAQRA
jgi:gentisate 1,2-dioxygenase